MSAHGQLVVVAIGGNALVPDSEHRSVLDQYLAAGQTSHHIAGIVAAGYRVLITHGNGPQVGFVLMRSEIAKDVLHQIPMEVCVADTQGATGYQIEQTLGNALRRRGQPHEIACIVTQVVVDADDPAFAAPTKPVGPHFGEAEARRHAEVDGWQIADEDGRGWRRVVPSPAPLEVVELPVIRSLLEDDVVVIAGGGGGIPVTRAADGSLTGCAAVIDKDLVSCMMACALNADTLILATNVDRVCLNFQQSDERKLDRVTVSELEEYVQEGHFNAGSMLPKIRAAMRFIASGGSRAIITRTPALGPDLDGIDGTHIVPD